MKLWKLLPIFLLTALTACLTQGEIEDPETYKTPYAERMKMLEEEFYVAQKEGNTITGVIIEGNTLFNGTTEPQNKPYGAPYNKGEFNAVAISAERNSKLFILTKDGQLYYPTPPKGQAVSGSEQAYRIDRVLTEKQKSGPKMFTWATMVPMVGREIEVYGEVYPGYVGVKGINIKSIQFSGQYIVGQKEDISQ
jgi:hypothetical protein